eukprot:3326362-Pyramimonas_sp.AAC.1
MDTGAAGQTHPTSTVVYRHERHGGASHEDGGRFNTLAWLGSRRAECSMDRVRFRVENWRRRRGPLNIRIDFVG